MCRIDMNSDLGESFGNYSVGMDEEIIKCITSANIGCGFHAGDPVVMGKTVALCKKYGVAAGAHPGYPDLLGFGRRNMVISPEEAKAYIKYQVGALMAFTKSCGIPFQHVKPHGSLYNMAAKDYKLSRAICEAVYEIDPGLILVALANSETVRAAKDVGVNVRNEIFGDRAYMDDGTLVPRSMEGAMIHDQAYAIERAIRMVKDHTVVTLSGKTIEIVPDTICVHGDNPQAIAFVKEMRAAFENAGISVKKMSE